MSDLQVYDHFLGTWGQATNWIPDHVNWDLGHQGYSVINGAVPISYTQRARRLLNLEIVNWGLTKEQFDEWHQNKAWFPTLRNHEEIVDLSKFVPKSLYGDSTFCEPQILCHWPDEATSWEFEYHLDQEPSWAEGRTYRLIAGVALTDNNAHNGGLVALPPFSDQGDPVELTEGSIVVFNPKVWHRSGLNKTPDVRMMVYFRWLNAPGS